MSFYNSEHYSPDAFRLTLTTKFSKELLKKHHLQANTAYRVLYALSGFITRRNNKIFNKSLNYIAFTAGVCKESAIKAVNFLDESGQIKIEKGKGRYSNSYIHKFKETKVFHTKNGAFLPFLSLADYQVIKKLNHTQRLSKTALSFMPYILIHAGKKGGFHASKKTILSYSGRDRRTLNKAYDELIEKKVLIERPLFSSFKLPHNKGQRAFIVNREHLSSLTQPIDLKKTA